MLLLAPSAVMAGPQVATLTSKNTAPYQKALAGFLRGFEGEVLQQDLELDDDALARIRAAAPAVVVAMGANAARAARSLAPIPVVYCVVLDPAGQGIGGPQVVGVPVEIPALTQLGELKRLLPGAARVGLIFNPARAGGEVAASKAAAAKLGLELIVEPAQSVAQFPAALQKLLPRVDALWLLADATVVTQDTFRLMLQSATARKLPLLVFSDEFVRHGALFALAPDFEGAGEEAAKLTAGLLAGKKPAELEAARPRWNLVYSPAAARSLGLTLPEEALKGARAVP